MPAPVINVSDWVSASPPAQLEFRQAVHVILNAIAHDLILREKMIMKGGILLAVRYHSPRFTKDIDFSTSTPRGELSPGSIREVLDRALPPSVESLDYDLDCAVQKYEMMPKRDDASFPSIRISIGYAYKGSAKHKRLLTLTCPDVVTIDFSLNEPILTTEPLPLGGPADGTLLTYAFSDLFAEKIRSLLQQEIRNRYRRQDIYDLFHLLKNHARMTPRAKPS